MRPKRWEGGHGWSAHVDRQRQPGVATQRERRHRTARFERTAPAHVTHHTRIIPCVPCKKGQCDWVVRTTMVGRHTTQLLAPEFTAEW